MPRRHLVAICFAAGATMAAALIPGLVTEPECKPPAPPAVKPGFIIDRQVTDTGCPAPSVYTESHKFREVKPGEPGYVPEPRKGEKGYEGPTS